MQCGMTVGRCHGAHKKHERVCEIHNLLCNLRADWAVPVLTHEQNKFIQLNLVKEWWSNKWLN